MIAVPPALSIVIPAYNVAPYIRDAVTSALDQSFSDIEVIVVDDGSTDETPEILVVMVRERADPRLRIVRQENGGLSAARNTGIAESQGELIGFLDGDDVWLLNKAARHIEAMQADPGIGLSFSHSAYMQESGALTERLLLSRNAAPGLHDMIRRNHVGNGSSPVLRRSCLEAAGVFDTRLRACEDYELWCRMLAKTACRAALVPAPLTLYRMRHSSLSYDADRFAMQADAAMRILRAALPDVPKRVFRAGHAEHYRIAAWKAASSGQNRIGARLLWRAIRLKPTILLLDRRAFATGVWLVLPGVVRRMVAPRLALPP